MCKRHLWRTRRESLLSEFSTLELRGVLCPLLRKSSHPWFRVLAAKLSTKSLPGTLLPLTDSMTDNIFLGVLAWRCHKILCKSLWREALQWWWTSFPSSPSSFYSSSPLSFSSGAQGWKNILQNIDQKLRQDITTFCDPIEQYLKDFFQLCWCQRPASFPPGPPRWVFLTFSFYLVFNSFLGNRVFHTRKWGKA